jgi:uncharacterized membrane protein
MIPFTRSPSRALALSNAALLFVFLLATVFAVPRLPGRVPSHFDGSGKVDAWGGPSILWLLPGLCVVLVSVIHAMSRLVIGRPNLWIGADRDLFEQLSSIDRREAIERMRCIPGSTSIGIAIMFMAIQSVVYWTAASNATGRPYILPIVVAVGLVVTGLLAIGTQMSVRSWMRTRLASLS